MDEDEVRTEAWWGRRAWVLLSAVRARAPLVQCITNLVSMDIVANALLAAGASPAMLTASARSQTSVRAATPSTSTSARSPRTGSPPCAPPPPLADPGCSTPSPLPPPASGWRPVSRSSHSALPLSGGTRPRFSPSPLAQTTPPSRALTVHMTHRMPCKPRKHWHSPTGL